MNIIATPLTRFHQFLYQRLWDRLLGGKTDHRLGRGKSFELLFAIGERLRANMQTHKGCLKAKLWDADPALQNDLKKINPPPLPLA